MPQFSLLPVALAPLMLLAAPAGAQAPSAPDEEPHWYGSAAATISFPRETEGLIANAPTPGATVRAQNPFTTGFGGALAIGRRIGRGRAEVEVGYVHDRQDRYVAIVPPTGTIPADVDQKSLRVMANGYLDLGRGAVRPYLGAGLGVVRTDLRNFAAPAPAPTAPARLLIDDGTSMFAYQLIGGASVRLARSVRVFGQYRWFDAGDFEIRDTRGEQVSRTVRGHNIDIGLRIGF